MEQSFLPLHDLPFFIYYDPLVDHHYSTSKLLDPADNSSLRCLDSLPPHHFPRAHSASILSSATFNPLSVLNMSTIPEQPTIEVAESRVPTASASEHAPDASSSCSTHQESYAQDDKPSTRERIRAMQAEDDERAKTLKQRSKHTEIISEEVFDEQPRAILDQSGVPFALGVAALESRYAAMKSGERELPNPHMHRHQRERERRRARRREPPAKPTPEQTALGKYRLAYECYDDEYRDEILTYMYKCMVRFLNLR